MIRMLNRFFFKLINSWAFPISAIGMLIIVTHLLFPGFFHDFTKSAKADTELQSITKSNVAKDKLKDGDTLTANDKREKEVDRFNQIERVLDVIKTTIELDEQRGYQNKMIGRELIRNIRLVVIVLIANALLIPLIFWLISRYRASNLVRGSSDLASTLLEIEARQTKLTNILKEIQDEVDYIQTLSAPDLKKLLEQAEKYLKQNEKDLAATKSMKDKQK